MNDPVCLVCGLRFSEHPEHVYCNGCGMPEEHCECLIICGTGHRPGTLGGYGDDIYRRLVDLASAALGKYQPVRVISGMALGWDQALAEASINLGIETIGAIPCLGQESRWPQKSQDKYFSLVDRLSRCEILSERYNSSVMQARNVWMVDRSNMVLALYSGVMGGTHNCVVYAQAKGVKVVNLWSSWIKYK